MKKIKFKKAKINFFALIRYLFPITIVIIVIILGFLINFLYNNVYQTIIQAELITNLRKEVSEENLEKDKFEKVINNIKTKSIVDQLNFDQLRNPFQENVKE